MFIHHYPTNVLTPDRHTHAQSSLGGNIVAISDEHIVGVTHGELSDESFSALPTTSVTLTPTSTSVTQTGTSDGHVHAHSSLGVNTVTF